MRIKSKICCDESISIASATHSKYNNESNTQMKREISRSEGDLIDPTGGLSQKGHKKGILGWLSNFFSRKKSEEVFKDESIDEEVPGSKESSEKLVRKTSNIEKARLNNLIISNEGIKACGQREEIVNQTEVIPEVKDQQLPTDFTVYSQDIHSEEEKTPEKPARKNTEILKSKNPQNLPGTVPVMQPMMKMPDFQNELSKKLQKRFVENEENEVEERIDDEKEKKNEIKSVVGKLNPNKTAGLKLEMRLPGMHQPKMPLPNLQGASIGRSCSFGIADRIRKLQLGSQAQTKTRSKSTGDNNEVKTNVDMNTTFEQHKVQLRKKQNKRAPTREHRRSKAMSAFPNELDVINSMDI